MINCSAWANACGIEALGAQLCTMTRRARMHIAARPSARSSEVHPSKLLAAAPLTKRSSCGTMDWQCGAPDRQCGTIPLAFFWKVSKASTPPVTPGPRRSRGGGRRAPVLKPYWGHELGGANKVCVSCCSSESSLRGHAWAAAAAVRAGQSAAGCGGRLGVRAWP